MQALSPSTSTASPVEADTYCSKKTAAQLEFLLLRIHSILGSVYIWFCDTNSVFGLVFDSIPVHISVLFMSCIYSLKYKNKNKNKKNIYIYRSDIKTKIWKYFFLFFRFPLSRFLAKTLRVNRITMKTFSNICRSESSLNCGLCHSCIKLRHITWMVWEARP